MVESKITLTMRCDKCQSFLTDNYGHIVEITDDYSEYMRPYDDIYKIAKEKGWLCTPTKGCLCPSCLKEGAE